MASLRPIRLLHCMVAATIFAVSVAPSISRGDELQSQALAAAKRATAFLTERVSTEGGYLWRYSEDLTLREGEGVADDKTVWVQPPGTPAVGEAFVNLYVATNDQQFLDAALLAADALRRGQMRSGGWQASIDFDPDRGRRWAYRIHDKPSSRAKDQSSLDDDKTQSALRFLIQLDEATGMKNEAVHEMVTYGIDGLLQRGQFRGPGFPQVWTDHRGEGFDTPAGRGNYPDSWPREYQGHNEYWYRYTLNDHLARDVMKVLFLARRVYGDESDLGGRCRDAAIRLADSLVAAQMPEPQPAWAQQYNAQMQPIWARKFEPTAITSSESFSVIETLLMVYRATGDAKYLEPIPPALRYLKTCELDDGRVSRFYELRTNRPLYFTTDYKLTYDDGDLPTHYGFQLDSRVDRLSEQYRRVASQPAPVAIAELWKPSNPGTKAILSVIETQDESGAWVSEGGLKYHKKPGPVIEMSVAVKNLNSLAAYLNTPSR